MDAIKNILLDSDLPLAVRAWFCVVVCMVPLVASFTAFRLLGL